MHSFLLHWFAQYFVRGGGGAAGALTKYGERDYASVDLSLVMSDR